MKILWLIKRKTMGQDVISQKYGRYYHLPVELARQGHSVTVLALDYRNAHSECINHSGVVWNSEGNFFSGLLRYVGKARELILSEKPDWIIGATDMQFSIMAYLLGKKYNIAVAHDVYDDFETFASGRLLRLSALFYSAMNRSQLVISFHHKLGAYLQQKVPQPRHAVVANCADPAVFHPMDRQACRNRLRLPEGIPIVGYFGAIQSKSGMEVLWKAFEQVRRKKPDVLMVVAGKANKNINLDRKGVVYKGFLSHDEIPFYINACDVVVIICYKKLNDLKHSMPLKSYEYMACSIPFVAPDVGGLPEEKGVVNTMLYKPNDVEELSRALLNNLYVGRQAYPKQTTWVEAGSMLSEALDGDV
jgi:glycosyltransferase involved in cell wall biosynthesis